MPQDPVGGWSTEPTKALLDHVIEITHADKNRISVTGVSMGGFGTWSMLAAYPTFFESAAPIASDAYEDLSAVKSRVLALSGTADGYDGQSGVDAINNGTGGGHAEHKWVEGATHSDMCHIYADTTYNPMPFLMATDNASTITA
jgi:poly(3-hydroxybutyrate) depolymerase